MGRFGQSCSSALESFDVVCVGCAEVIGGSPPDTKEDAEQCLFCSPLGFWGGDGGGEQSATGVCFRQQGRFKRDRPLLCVCVRVMAKRCFLRYLTMNRSGSRMKIEVSGVVL